MKKLLLGLTLMTSITNSNAASFGAFTLTGGMDDVDGAMMMMMTSTITPVGLSIAGQITAGLIVMGDNSIALDLENETVQDEILGLQIAIDENTELSETQKAILSIGMSSNQLDDKGNVL